MYLCTANGNLSGLLLTLYAKLFLAKDKLNMARAALVGVDTTVSAVSAAALLGGLVDLNVRDLHFLSNKSLSLGIANGVLQQVQNELGALLGPATLGDTEGLGLGATTNTTVETTEWDALLVSKNVSEVTESL